jgi:hypothetical protein
LTCLVIFVLLCVTFTTPKTSALGIDDSKVFVLEAPQNTVYFIYSSILQDNKPLGVAKANAIDWTATGYIKGMTRNPQLEGLDTEGNLVDQTTGTPMFSDKAVVLSGGPLVQVLVKYYETQRISPVYFEFADGKCYWVRSNGNRIEETGIVPSEHNDMFLVEHFIDPRGNSVLVIYGYTGLGSFAGARFFKTVVYSSIRDYTHSYYIFHWVDANNDSFPDMNEVDTTPVAYG